MTINKNKIVIATGGTGGHVFPAYSLAKNLIKNSYLVEIITDKRGLKYLDKHKDIKIILNDSATIFFLAWLAKEGRTTMIPNVVGNAALVQREPVDVK